MTPVRPQERAGEHCLVVSTDDNYALPAAVAVRSAIDHYDGPTPLRVVLFYFGDDGPGLRRLRQTFRDDPVEIESLSLDTFAEWPAQRYFGNNAVYARLALGRFLDESVDRVVYLDADTLTSGDLSTLWTMSLEGRPLAAAQEMNGPFVSHRGGLQRWREAGIPPDAKYFNSGVLVIDLGMWRGEELEQKCFAFLERFRNRIRFPDQDALNAVLWDRWVELDQGFNASAFWDSPKYSAAEHGDVLSRVRVFHFQGPTKPWHDDYPVASRRAAFEAVVARTAWGPG